MRPLILASRSPRRRQLLAEAGYQYQVVPPADPDEDSIRPGECPAEFVARLAREKARKVGVQFGEGLILGCDTVAEWEGQILGQPCDRDHARQILQTLSGREHRVHSGLCLWDFPGGKLRTEVAETTLRMETLSAEQIEEYLDSGLWEGKAGAFGYQDRLGWLQVLTGSESNVVGLPLELLAELMADFH